MSSPNSCLMCQRPLAVDSDSELCPVCLCGVVPSEPPPSTPPDSIVTPVFHAAAHVAARLSATIPMRAARITPFGPPPDDRHMLTDIDGNQTRSAVADDSTARTSFDGRDRVPDTPPGYDLIGPLGAGGWASVYLAREHATERIVAIKFLHAPTSTIAFDRFLVEARSLARLDHPNIIKVISADMNWREPFLTMEYADGGTLADLAKPGKTLPTPTEAAQLLLGACDAIAAAHAAGILHRDLKPSNVLLTNGRCEANGRCQPAGGTDLPAHAGRSPAGGADLPAGGAHQPAHAGRSPVPKVSDFGLAKRTDHDEGLTRTGPLGTPCYMSPEAASGRYREIGPAADIYGLGATLYQLLSGRPPFVDELPDEILRKVMTELPDRLRSLRPAVPAELEAIVAKAMEKLPAARYASAAAMADDLRRFLSGHKPIAPVQSPRRRAWRWLVRRRVGVGLLALALLAAASLVAFGIKYGLKQRAVPAPVDPDAQRAEYVARARADLAAGKTVILLGDRGQLKWHQSWLEQANMQTEVDGTCGFRAFSQLLYQIAPADLGGDHYKVSLEIRQLRPAFTTPPGQVSTDAVGFYFGHGMGTTAQGKTVHSLFTIMYKDYEFPPDLKPTPRRAAFLTRMGYIQDPDLTNPKRLIQLEAFKLAAATFTPAPGRKMAADPQPQPGEWRRIDAEFSPNGIAIDWRADRTSPDEPDRMVPLARWNRSKLREQYEIAKRELDAQAPGATAVLPEWSPRMGFGVVANRSTVAIRRITIKRISAPL